MTNRSYTHPYPQDRDPLSKAWNSITSYISKEVSKEVRTFREFREVDYPKVRHMFQPVKHHVLNMTMVAIFFAIPVYFFTSNPVPELPHIGYALFTSFSLFFIAGAYLNLAMCAYHMLRCYLKVFPNWNLSKNLPKEEIAKARPNAEAMVTHIANAWSFQMLCVLMIPFAAFYCAAI